MRAVIVKTPGDNVETLALAEISPPMPSDKEVLIKVKYASLNPVDYKLIAQQPAFWVYPYVVGLDAMGEVVKLGKDVSRFRIGDFVAVHGNLTYGGALAEYAVHPEHVLFHIPRSFDFRLAAAIPCAGLTAYQALVRKMNIKSGKTIFIQAGSGGVGGFAIIIAKQLGLNVITSCSAKNTEYVRRLGANIVIDYTLGDVYTQIQALYPNGVDYILETTSKINLQYDLDILAFNGQIASIVGVLETKDIPEFVTGVGFHEIALGGAYLSNHYPSQSDLGTMGQELVNLLDLTQIHPQLNCYDLDDYDLAFVDLKASKNPGKVVIKI